MIESKFLVSEFEVLGWVVSSLRRSGQGPTRERVIGDEKRVVSNICHRD